MSFSLKLGFDRPRPELVSPMAYTMSSSFPSGHALLAATTYLTLGALLARVHPNRLIKAYLMFLAILLTLIVDLSRIYLGVHWPTARVLVGRLWMQRLGSMDREQIKRK